MMNTVIFSANADLVSLDGSFGSNTSIIGGSGADTLVFINGGNVGAATIRGGVGNDSMEFSGNLVSGVFAGDAGADFFTGSISVGVTGVSFWGGSGADTFNFTDIVTDSGTTGGTAYFWNEEGLTPSSLLMASVSVPLMTMSVPITVSSLVSTLMLP